MQCHAGPGQTGLLVMGRRVRPGANLGACSPLKHCDTKLTVRVGLTTMWGKEGGGWTTSPGTPSAFQGLKLHGDANHFLFPRPGYSNTTNFGEFYETSSYS